MTRTSPPITTTGVASSLRALLPPDAPVRITAYDGSEAGPADAAVRLRLTSELGLRRMLTAPGSLGPARAFIAGELEVEGDLYEALSQATLLDPGGASWAARLAALRAVGIRQLRPVPPPPEEVGTRSRLRLGRKHSRRRDAAVISHHYDVSNRFYELLLGPSMAYTCSVFPRADATLEQAQWEKHDLIARKLALRPGMRLLDVGCGWGGMVRHAAREYGVRALGVTLSRRQAEWAQEAIRRDGLEALAEVRFLDYRDVPDTGFDAVSSIGLTEHIGRAQLGAYVRTLHGKLRPGGRLLNHCITRPTTREPATVRRGFINTYVFPDGELLGVGTIVSAIQDNGFEVRHEENLREHYARTVAAWSANLAASWTDCVTEVGVRTARVWALYLAGSRLGFERNQIQLHQVLAVRPESGRSGMALRPDW